jgi:hypothetical protein
MNEKTCSKCKIKRPIIEFNLSQRGYDNYCRECRKAYSRKYYQEKRSEFFDRSYRYHPSIIKAFNRLKGTAPCADCGQIYPSCVMTIDGRSFKERKLGHIGRIPEDEIDQILTRFVMVCANCACIREWKREHALPVVPIA